MLYRKGGTVQTACCREGGDQLVGGSMKDTMPHEQAAL